MVETNKELARELEAIYTPLEEAKTEIWRRWSDKDLKKKVDNFLKDDVPEIFRDSPKAVLARHVLSPHYELSHFLELSKMIGLKALCLEYLDDKFVAENIDKYYLGKLFFHKGNNRNENDVIATLKAIEINKAEGNNICTLETMWGENLVDFHHKLIDLSGLNNSIDIFDISDYYKRNGTTAKEYYIYFFSLYICYAVLIENYLLDKKQIDFTMEVALPSYKKVLNIFGLKPLIVHLGPVGEEENLCWRYYPISVKNIIDKLLI